MMSRRWLIFIFFSVLGYGLAFLLFPRVMPAARWEHKLSRSEAVATAKNIANAFGAAGYQWVDNVSAEYSRKREYYLRTASEDVGREFLTPVQINVRLSSPENNRKATVILNSDGRLLEFALRGPSGKSSEEKPDNVVPPADQQAAESAIKTMWGENLFSALNQSDSSVNRQGSRLRWKSSGQQMKIVVNSQVQDGKIHRLSLIPEFSTQFDSEFNARRSTMNKIMASVATIAIWPFALLVVIYFFVGLALKRIQHKQGIVFLCLMFAVMSVINWLDGLSIQTSSDFDTGGNYWLSRIIGVVLMFLAMLLLAATLYFIWTAGQSLAIRLPDRRTISLELILRGKPWTKPVARSFAAGLLTGGIIVSIPLLLAASGIFPGMELDSADLEDYLASRVPSALALVDGRQYLLFLLFGFMAPLVAVYVKRPLLMRLLVFILILLGMLGGEMVYLSAPGLLLSSFLTALALTILYYRIGLLSVILSLSGVQMALGASTLLAQPSASLHAAGWRVVAGLVILVGLSLVGVWKFREPTEEETAIPEYLLETRVERERLKAEFNVARRAQQQMLPDAPPQIQGLDIAAVCHPSREVGGDLYDFLSLPGGQLGIVVADVSGKGVPASLYMTLTKGLLASVAETTGDPGEILREVNRHLYEVCRRKMFVTLFLGVIDPATRTLTFARAGHNPTVFRRPAEQTTSLLKSKGMGLGLNNGSIFNRSLQVDSLQLQPNDKLYFYSDGITEAMNPKNDEYGEDRLQDLAARLDSAGAAEARDAVLTDVKQFLGSNQPQDDQTLVVVRVV